MIQAVIFDIDGVFVSTDELHFRAWERLAAELGIPVLPEEYDLRQRGIGRMESLEIILEKSGKIFSEEEKEALAERKNSYYIEMLDEVSSSSVLPGSLAALSFLHSRNIPAAIGSASKNAALILQKAGLSPYFDVVADGNDTTFSKPDPQIFRIAAGKLNINPESCLVVDSANAGIEAGHIAGMFTLGLGLAANNPLADFSAESLADIRLDWNHILS